MPNKFFSALGIREFIFACVLYYILLFIDLFLMALAIEWNAAGEAVRAYALGAVVFLMTLGLASRVDCLWLSYKSHRSLFAASEFGGSSVDSAIAFYLRCFAFYVFSCGALILMVVLEDRLHEVLYLYLVFLSLSIFGAHLDYLLPSYKRYRQLASEGQWGVFSRMVRR